MIEFLTDTSAAVTGAFCLLAGAGLALLWHKTKDFECRAEALDEARASLNEAFDLADDILANPSVSTEVRLAMIRMLAAHSDPDLGKRASEIFLRSVPSPTASESPLVEAMNRLQNENRLLAQQIHHALLTLMLGLVIVNKADEMTVSRVRERTASSPESLWTRVSRAIFTNDPHGPHAAAAQ